MKTNKQNQASYKERKREAGFVLVAIWVRKEKKQKLKKYAEKLNDNNLG